MIIVKRGSAGDDHSSEAVEIEEHLPLKFQLYNAQHTHISYGVMLIIQASTYLCRLPNGTQDFLQQQHYCALISWTLKCSGSLLAISVAHCPTNLYTLMWLLVPLVSFPGHSSCVHNSTICGLVTCSDGLLNILIKDNK